MSSNNEPNQDISIVIPTVNGTVVGQELSAEDRKNLEYQLRENIILSLGGAVIGDVREALDEYKNAGFDLNNVFNHTDETGQELGASNCGELFDSTQIWGYGNTSEANFDIVTRTLNLLDEYENKAIPRQQIAMLIACAATKLDEVWQGRLQDKNPMKLAPAAVKLIEFSREIISASDNEDKTAIEGIIKPSFDKLRSTIAKAEDTSKQKGSDYKPVLLNRIDAFSNGFGKHTFSLKKP